MAAVTGALCSKPRSGAPQREPAGTGSGSARLKDFHAIARRERGSSQMIRRALPLAALYWDQRLVYNERRPAFAAELRLGQRFKSAARTVLLKPRTTLGTEHHSDGILKPAAHTAHAASLLL